MTGGKKTSLIYFHYVDTSFFFPQRTRVKKFILSLFKNEGFKVATVNYIFCNDDYLLRLNQAYLQHETYTDIITFGLSGAKEAVTADIYISVERVKENANAFAVPFLHELQRVIFHGALHMCGYKDKTAKDVKLMRFKENHYLDLYSVSRETKRTKS